MFIKSVLKKLHLDDIFYEQESIKNEKTLSFATGKSTTFLKNSAGVVHGTVSVSDGKVIVTDPENDGSYATLIVPDNPMVQVFVNGEFVQGEVVLSKSHIVDIKLSSVEPSISYGETVSNDELSVVVQVNVVKGVKLLVKDGKPVKHLKLKLEEIYTYPDSIHPEAILNLLFKKGYKGEIDYSAVNRLCNAKETQKEVVLRGVAPQNGKPTRLRLSASIHSEKDPVFRTMKFPRVTIGTTCAVLETEFEGVPGTNVYGVQVPPQKSEDKIPTFGNGVNNLDGNIVAIQDGRLVYTNYLIDVVPEMVFETDITEENGTIQFNGNIVIQGSIRKRASVNASGMITVYGDIEMSSVLSGQGILVQGGIYGSNLVSGHQQIVYENLSRLLDKMIPELKRFGYEYSLMMAHAMKRFDAYTTIPKIPAILFEKRHENLTQVLKQFVDDYSEELSENDTFYRELKELVQTTWTGEHRLKVSQKDFEILRDKFVSFNDKMKSCPKELTVVKATDVSNSTVRSVGDIIVERSCYSSTLESGNTLSVHKALRGGFVVAKKSVYVNELGAPSGVETSVRVDDPSGFIRVDLIHINTLLDVNGKRLRTFDTKRDIRYGGIQRD